MKLFLLALIALATVNAISHEESFKLWTIKHNKNYLNDAEYTYRLGVYRSNLEFIEDHNRANKGFSVAMNEFGDMTATEFADLYNNFNMENLVRNGNNDNSDEFQASNPSSVNWVQQGAVTGVKNQGQCGSCWSFSATGSTEGAHFLKTGSLVSLSEQNLVDCSGSYGNMGCNGGLMDDAFKYIINNNGIDTEASYPYTAQDGTCSFSRANVGATLSSYTDVTSGSETGLENAIVGRPVSVAIDASHSSFQFYSGGVYYEPACSSTQLDHGVLAVGYNNAGGADSKYYLVKNSWGTSWGLSGYIHMAKDRNNNCGIATAASYPTA